MNNDVADLKEFIGKCTREIQTVIAIVAAFPVIAVLFALIYR